MPARVRSPAAPARKRLPKAERYEGILAAAEQVFCQLGYDAATMADVAQRAGVVEGNVYRYFKSKRELVARVVSDWYSRKLDELEREVRQIASVRSRLRYLIAAHLRSLRDSPGLMRLIIRELRTGDPEFSRIVGGLNQRYTAFLRLALEEGVRTGELRPDTPVRLLRDMVFGGIEHHAARYLAGIGTLDVETAADQMLALVLQGAGRVPTMSAPSQAEDPA
ncbi:MAG TPA: TetR/AcrR family transcriptional regulator [Rubrivivax sp.]|nr:TetR/AcrR family transcriptional regulator [Burkholderiales bacterium]HNT38183.1 TetR/AcrR family transcriptional regulator [Rubrivivax sp.]